MDMKVAGECESYTKLDHINPVFKWFNDEELTYPSMEGFTDIQKRDDST